MDKDIQIRQIILATDGESNVGPNPISIAKEVYKKGITVSTIGIVDGKEREGPLAEVHSIADSGGGICEVTDMSNFSRTMEMVTQKSVYKTIEQAVNKELKSILGKTLDGTHPETRKKITDIIDKYGEEATLKCCIMMDCSGSMTKKINIAKNSILNLLKVLKSRKGKSEVAVIGFPGKSKMTPSLLCPFTDEIIELERGLQNISIGGVTPTGSALEWVAKMMLEENVNDIIENRSGEKLGDEGILESNII